MANIWENPSVIAAEALMHLEDALVISRLAAKDVTSEFNTKSNGWSVGNQVSFRTHGEYSVSDFSTTVSVQPIASSTRSMTIEHLYDVSVQVGAREEAMNLDSFSEQVIRPAAYKLAETVDTYVGTKILEAAGLYVSSSLGGSAADLALARKAAILQQLSMNRYAIVDLDLEAVLLGQTWFNQSQTRGAAGEETLRSGNMGFAMGIDWNNSIAFPTTSHTAGNMVCATNNTSGTKNLIGDTSLVVDTQTASKSLAAGDRIAIAGVRRPLVVKTAIADTSATTSIELVDPITEVIPDDAAVTVVGSGATFTFEGAIFDDQSIGVAFPILDLPGDKVAAVMSANGISIRIVKGYDMSTKTTMLSMDLLVGALCLDPRRITLLADSV